jgi:23S rRNA (uridine2552-2'-O)-methyltransferase
MKRFGPKHDPWEDHYARLAKKQGFPARSVFKLREIQRKYHLIKKGHKVIDLGCFPGSWLLYAADLVGQKGRVVGIDLKPVKIDLPPHVKVYSEDVLSLDETLLEKIGIPFDVMLSDMAPGTTGNKQVDAARSYELCQSALDLSRKVLKPGGSFVCKIFHGADIEEFVGSVGSTYKQHKLFKPQSSRKASKEIFIIGLGKKT